MGFGALDYAAVSIYLAGVLGMGYGFMRRQKSTSDYFVGGRRFHWLPVAISMFTALFSVISYIAAPAEAFNHGMTLSLFVLFMLLAIPVAAVVFVRFFRHIALTSVYEYLERRFDLRVRLATSFLFLALRSFYLGVVLFASAVALYPILGWPLWLSVIVVGAVATACAAMGGLEGLVWIDVAQFFVLLGGILVVLGLLIADHPEGFSGIWAYAQARNHTFGPVAEKSFYSFDPFQRVSLWVLVISAVFHKLSAMGADQVTIQRYVSTRSERDAVQSMIWGTVLSIPVLTLLYLTGLGLFYYYGAHPDRSLPNMTGDLALMHFVANELPPGVGGFIVAGIVAAVLTTVCSVLNSLATCSITDFYGRVLRPDASDRRRLAAAKAMTVVWGIVSILCAGLIMWLFGTEMQRNPLIEVSNVTLNLFTGILLGVFSLGILSRRATAAGALWGALGGLGAALAVTAPYYFRALPPGAPKLSFLWINIIGCLVTFGAGYGVSLLDKRPMREKLAGLTFWDKQPSNSLKRLTSSRGEIIHAQESN